MRKRKPSRAADKLRPIVRAFMGFPAHWFEPCEYYCCDGVERDGKLYLPGTTGNPFRMKARYRKRARWNAPNSSLEQKEPRK